MRVLLIHASREIFPMGTAPLGPAYLASSLKREGHSVKIVDAALATDFRRSISQAVTEFRPDVVGVTVRNIDWLTWPHDVYSWRASRPVIEFVRKQTDALIILGGAGFTVCAEAILRELGGDYLGVIGEGELTLPSIVQCLETGSDPRQLDRGVCYIDDGGAYVQKPPWRVPDLDALSFPARELVENHSYTLSDGRVVGNIQTLRGCNRDCIFCTYPYIEGTRVRLRSPEAVAEELDILVNRYHVPNVFFVDSTINLAPSHLRGICEAILERGIRVNWGANFRADVGSLQLLPLMRDAGCVHLAIGADALCDSSLKALHKDTTYATIQETTRVCHELQIEVLLSVFLGNPGEDIGLVKKTLTALEGLDFIKGSWEGHNSVMIQPGIRILPNTPLASLARREGMILEDDLLFPQIYISNQIDPYELIAVIKEHVSQYPEWWVPGLGVNLDYTGMLPWLQSQIALYNDPNVMLVHDIGRRSLE